MIKDRTIQTCMEKLLAATVKSLETNDKVQQSAVITLIEKFASSETTSERTLLMCYRQMLFYLVNPKSLVVANATLCAETMCQRKGILTTDLYIWYKEPILNEVIRLAVSVYLEYGLLFDKTLANVRTLFVVAYSAVISIISSLSVQRNAGLFTSETGAYEKRFCYYNSYGLALRFKGMYGN